MCVDGKCCGCIPQETATLVLAVFNSLYQLGMATYNIVYTIYAFNLPISEVFNYSGNIIFESAIKFLFAVVLCFGITKKNLVCLKVFMVSAVIAIVIDTTNIILFVINVHNQILPMLPPILNIFLMMLLLVMVVLTHRKMVKAVY